MDKTLLAYAIAAELNPLRKFAYFGIPHFGGTYTVYRSLRAGLLSHGIEVRWLGAARSALSTIDPVEWAEEIPNGEMINDPCASDAELAKAMNAHIEANYDGVFVTVLGNHLQTNAIRYMTEQVKRVMIVHTPSLGTLGAARAVVEHVHATVAVSERTRSDLVSKYSFVNRATFCIPNAIDLRPFRAIHRPMRPEKCIRILSFGRIEEAAKGVFWLPKIIAGLHDVEFSLTVAGDGPDRRELERRLRPHASRVSFVGGVSDAEVPALYATHDVFVMPSRMEGFGQTLVEAMAAGCVPVASFIKGVTDTIISDRIDGFLFKMGSCCDAASHIASLAGDRKLLATVSEAARRNVCGRFDLATQAAAYAEVIESIMASPPAIASPLPYDQWSYPRGLRPGLRTTHLPESIKNLLRTWKERYAV